MSGWRPPRPVDATLLAYAFPSQAEVIQAVIDCGGNQSQAAEMLGRSRAAVKDVLRRVRARADLDGRPTPQPRPAASTPRPVAQGKAPAMMTDAVRALVELAQRGPLSLERACDALGWPPAAVRKLAVDAAESGYAIEFAGDDLTWRIPEPTDDVQDTGIAPVVGQRHEVAVISDLHFGSKWCGRAQLRDFLSMVRDRGITQVLGPGDNLDGCYKHSMWEQSHRGFDEQAEDFYLLWRDFPELHLHTIDGNHDDTLSEACGMSAGRALGERLASNGVTNYSWYGSRSAHLSLYGALIHLWHPRGSGAYAVSYKLQKKVEAYPVGQKPDLLFTGHYHQYVTTVIRGVHSFLCPTFQLPGGSFSNSLAGGPAVGGLVVGWELTEKRTLRNVRIEYQAYYAEEKPRLIAA